MISAKKVFPAAMALILVFGIIYSKFFCEGFRYIGEGVYYKLAKNIAFNHMYSLNGIDPSGLKLPGYPLALGMLVLLGSKLCMLKVANYTALCLSVYFMTKISGKMFGDVAACLSVLLVFFYPRFFSNASYLYPQTFGAALFLLVTYLVYAVEDFSFRRSFSVGSILGFLILTIPGFIVCAPVFMLRVLRRSSRSGLYKALLLFVMVCVFLGGWMTRNYVQLGSFSLSESAGRKLLQGNSNAVIPYNLRSDISEYREKARGLTAMKKSDFYQKEAIVYMKNNPVQCVELFFRKLVRYFAFNHYGRVRSFEQKIRKIVIYFTWGPLLALFLIRLCFLGKFKPVDFELALISIYVMAACFYAVLYPDIRYRIPFDFIPVIVVGGFLFRVFEGFFSRVFSGGKTAV